jgi:hypothetical protein
VDREQGGSTAAASTVDQVRNDVLSHAALASDQDVRIRTDRALDLVLDRATGDADVDKLLGNRVH